MPSHKTHDTITYLLLIFLIPISLLYIGINIYSLIFIISYIFAGLMFNGDLDCESKPYYRWKVFRLIWIPYQSLFKHRSFFTHGIIIGTLIRLLYILIIPLIFYYHEIINFVWSYPKFFVFLFCGLEVGSISHTVVDKIYIK